MSDTSESGSPAASGSGAGFDSGSEEPIPLITVSEILLGRVNMSPYAHDGRNNEDLEEEQENVLKNWDYLLLKKFPLKKRILYGSSCLLFIVVVIASLAYLCGPLIYKDESTLKNNLFNMKNNGSSNNYRPEFYRIRLHPDTDSFSGQITVLLKSLESNVSNQMSLECVGLNITSVQLKTRYRTSVKLNQDKEFYHQLPSEEIIPVKRFWQSSKQLHILAKENFFAEHKYLVNITFNGFLNYSNSGLYKSSFKDEGGTERWILSSNLKKTKFVNNAAYVFPCFDRFKVPIELSIARKTNVKALSNTQIKETEIINSQQGLVWDHFRPTPPIHTSQLAFALISHYKSLNITNLNGGTILKIWAPKNNPLVTQQTADRIAKTFNLLETYFKTNLDLQKLDFLYIPGLDEQFLAHYGLNFFRFDALFYDDSIKEEEGVKEFVDCTITKSITLQYLQFSEIFDRKSTWEISGAAEYFCEYFKQLSADIETKTLYFTESSGFKTKFLLRMLHSEIPTPEFDAFVKNYIFDFQSDSQFPNYNLTNTDISVKDFIESWMDDEDFHSSIVSLHRTTGWNFSIKEEHARPNGKLRIIPIASKDQNNETQKFVLFDQMEKNMFVNPNTWILLNSPLIGYYRTNYDRDNWFLLIRQLHTNPNAINVISRAHLINDAFFLANVGFINFDILIHLVRYLKNETNYLPWKAAIKSLSYYDNIYIDTSHYGKYREFKIKLLEYAYNQTELETKEDINEAMCQLNYKPCINKVLMKYENQRNRKDVSISKLSYCTYVKLQEDEWDTLYNQSQQLILEKDIQNIFLGLGCCRAGWRIFYLLEQTLTENFPINLIVNIWRSVANQDSGRLYGLKFLEDNWSEIFDRPYLHRIIIKEFVSQLSSIHDLYKIHNFYVKSPDVINEDDELSDAYEMAISRVHEKYGWLRTMSNEFLEQIAKF